MASPCPRQARRVSSWKSPQPNRACTRPPKRRAAGDAPGVARTTRELRLDPWSSPTPGSPQRADDDFAFIESVIEMAIYLAQVQSAQAGHSGFLVACANARKDGQNSEGLFNLSCENIGVGLVFNPPSLFALHMSLRSRCESNRTLFQRDLSSRRISSASTRRPAAMSASDWRRASWSAARSVSSSQSPGSSGSRSISVPSGRSVGSSNTSRPSRTRALIVMSERVTPRQAAQQIKDSCRASAATESGLS
jgi:hypothetical protein